ncbi:MAG TPA: alpha-amylase family glycosyl hydrolase [Mucilaginibacter sp.]|nr:alpha-amylase family glycosyl hydrolase [Mucilaginibacter sp.]
MHSGRIKPGRKFTLLLFSIFFVCAISYGQTAKTIDGHPAWIMQGNVYEVNVRQYTPQGTFNAFSKSLSRLKSMGVQTLWFMPINPISKVDRKGTLGSYYAVSNYTAINPEFGTMADFKRLVDEAHAMGFKVIIDWVPNHTGADNYWMVKHPDFYVKDKEGKPAVAFDWSDTRQLDYSNREMQDSMINAMKFWLVNTHIDGFRCDVAWNVPESFWARCIGELRKGRSLFMLAEGDKDYLHRSGFDATYSWDMFHKMIDVAKGASPAFALDSIKAKYDAEYPKNGLELYFTSNHDENSWNKADYGTFPGASHAPFAVLTQTYYHSVPLIYSGQEEPVLRAIQFFERDPITFKNFARAHFYRTLLTLRKNDIALASNASFRKIAAGDKTAIYAYVREKAGKKVLVILNLSPKEQPVTVSDKSLLGSTYDVFTGKKVLLNSKAWKMKPWGYKVYQY